MKNKKILGGFMNKYLVWFPALMVLGAVIYKPAKETTETKPVSKNISFSVYKSSSYTSGVYNNTSASVDLIVEKVSTKGQHTIVRDKKLDRKYLSQYPSVENALKQGKRVSNSALHPDLQFKRERITNAELHYHEIQQPGQD